MDRMEKIEEEMKSADKIDHESIPDENNLNHMAFEDKPVLAHSARKVA